MVDAGGGASNFGRMVRVADSSADRPTLALKRPPAT